MLPASTVTRYKVSLGKVPEKIVEEAKRPYTRDRRQSFFLSSDQVREIRRLSAEGLSQDTLSKRFNIAQPTVSTLLRGVTYRHVK